MNGEELTNRLREGGLKLAFDTNALFIDRKFTALCGVVSRWNEQLSAGRKQPVRLVVCTVAHAEKLFDLKQRWRNTFDIQNILAALRSKGLEVEPFDTRHALEMATRLGEFYPGDEAWRQAKRERCIRCIGLEPMQVPASGSDKRCGATVDWLIGAHARAEGCVLVTDDKGPELRNLERVSLDTLASALQQLISEPV